MVLAAGTHVGPYEVLSALRAGGRGEVYRARDTKLNREVALKLLPTGTGVSPFWSRHAMKLYFAASPGVNAWSVVTVTTEPVFGVSAEDAVPGPTLAGGGPNLPRPHDIADDQHLVALVSAGAGEIRREQIQFVLNWNEELKQRVRAK
jgi:hypothetical protein